MKTNKNLTLKYILENFPLRIALTDFCNLRCFFCSNEGMPADQKNRIFANYSSLKFLIEVLAEKGLKNISLTGGEPSLYPNLTDLIKLINSLKIENKFFHTNGIGLSKKLVEKGLKGFTKIAVSVHAFEPLVWQKMTGGSLSQYQAAIKNLTNLGETGRKIEIKHVPIKGVNDSLEIIKKTLDLCSENKFKFKFLNFEPIEGNQKGWTIAFSEMKKKLEELGCQPLPLEKKFRGQSNYLPLFWYQYGQAKGVLIEIGCGQPEVCRPCYLSNEIFVTPNLEIKPCHMNTEVIPLEEMIKRKDRKGICEAIVESRRILKKTPGKNKSYWRQQE